MAFGAGKAQDKGNVRMKGRVVAGKLEESIAEIILFQNVFFLPFALKWKPCRMDSAKKPLSER